jgi:hypothetical protein
MTEIREEIRDEVHRRFQVWGWQGAPCRRYAFLVAGYFRTRGPFGVEGEDKYLALPDGAGLRMVEWVEASADRPLAPTERADAARAVATFDDVRLRRSQRDACASPFDRFAVLDCLPLALADPRQAAARLILYPGAIQHEDWLHSPPQYPAVRQVMECLCPASWDHTAVDWTPPPEAVSWARRMYDEQAFTELPILADMLEDAGCPDRPLLDHCRQQGDHFRGCAAVDRLLGR